MPYHHRDAIVTEAEATHQHQAAEHEEALAAMEAEYKDRMSEMHSRFVDSLLQHTATATFSTIVSACGLSA